MKLLAPLATQNKVLCASTHASRNCLVLKIFVSGQVASWLKGVSLPIKFWRLTSHRRRHRHQKTLPHRYRRLHQTRIQAALLRKP